MTKKDPKVGTGKKPKGSGRRLYTDQTSFGDKKKIQFTHLLQALEPSYKQGVRLYQTATDTPTKTGELLTGKTLNINDQVFHPPVTLFGEMCWRSFREAGG